MSERIAGTPAPPPRPSVPRPVPLRRRARARALEGLVASAGLVPEAALRAALRGVAALAGRGRPGELARANLELALGDELDLAARERIAGGVRRHAARQLAEWVRLARGAPPEGPAGAWVEERVALDGSVAALDDVLAGGRGAIVVTAHLGNWELLAARLARRGHRGAVVGRERPRDPTSRWLVRMREGYGAVSLPQDAPPRRLLEVLRAGPVVGLLADLDVPRLAGVELSFFGRPVRAMTAPAAIARASGLPLLPARCVAVDGRRYALRFEAPLELDRGLGRREATVELTARLMAVYERWIRDDPEQWAWHQPRWR